jgi:hypothetical protein
MESGIPFGEYLLLRRLGKGGMAEVFLAKRIRAKGFEKLLVVKRLLPHLSRVDQAAEMFLHEARVAALIDHPNLAHVSDFGEVRGSYYLAMEYVQGLSLADIVTAVDTIPAPVAIRIAIELLDALHAIHTTRNPDGQPLGLVHRDVSPRNVMIRPDGVVKLLDLGIVSSERAGDARVMGTKGYMSPEQSRAERVDPRSDLFSLGALLLRVIAGVRARGTAVTLPNERPAEIPAELWRILESMLAPDPERRPRSALDVRTELEAFVAPFGVEASRTQVAELVQRAERARSFGRRVLNQVTRIVRVTRWTRLGPEPAEEGEGPPKRSWRRAFLLAFLCGALISAVVQWASGRREKMEPYAASLPPVVETTTTGTVSMTPFDDEGDEGEEDRVTDEPWMQDEPAPQDEPRRIRRTRRREAQARGLLTIDTEPWTEVYMGGRKLGITPLERVRLPSGHHELELRNDQFGLRRRVKVVIQPGTVTRVHRSF